MRKLLAKDHDQANALILSGISLNRMQFMIAELFSYQRYADELEVALEARCEEVTKLLRDRKVRGEIINRLRARLERTLPNSIIVSE